MKNFVNKMLLQFKLMLKKDRLAVKKDFDFKTSFFKKSEEDKPYLTLSAKGTLKFDTFQLCLAALCVLVSSVALSLIFVRRR